MKLTHHVTNNHNNAYVRTHGLTAEDRSQRDRAGVLRSVKFREPSRGTSPTGQGSLARQKGLPLGAQLDYLQGQLRG